MEATSGDRLAGAAVACQAAGLLGLGVFLLARVGGSDIRSPGLLAALGVIVLGAAACYAFAARALARAARWPRTPCGLLQFFCVIVAIGLLQGHKMAYGVPLLAVAVVVSVLLVRAGPRRAAGSLIEEDA